jgi:hypothetical protein
MKSPSYNEYGLGVTTDPRYYGSECTQDDADRIAANLAAMIEDKFPGICVTITSERGVYGPDSETVEEIRMWVQENWTAAL